MTTRSVQKQVCRECPFRRQSPAGYLGESSGDPWDFLSSFDHGESGLACHMMIDWRKADAQECAQKAALCRGALTMLRNSCKLPRDPLLATAVRSVEPDHDNIFSHPNEFMEHHHDHQLAAKMRE